MTIAALGVMGSRSVNAIGTSIVITATTAGASIGNLVIVVTATDNISGADGVTNEITAVVDSVNNRYTKLGEYCNGDASSAGAVVSLWMSVLTAAIPITTGTITATCPSITAHAAVAYKYSLGVGYSAVPVIAVANNATDGAAPPSLSLSALPLGTYLFLRASAIEDDVLTGGPSTSWTEFANTSALSAAPMCAWGEHIITTVTSLTSAPTITASPLPDSASVMIALREDWVSTVLLRGAPL